MQDSDQSVTSRTMSSKTALSTDTCQHIVVLVSRGTLQNRSLAQMHPVSLLVVVENMTLRLDCFGLHGPYTLNPTFHLTASFLTCLEKRPRGFSAVFRYPTGSGQKLLGVNQRLRFLTLGLFGV